MDGALPNVWPQRLSHRANLKYERSGRDDYAIMRWPGPEIYGLKFRKSLRFEKPQGIALLGFVLFLLFLYLITPAVTRTMTSLPSMASGQHKF